MTAPMTSASSSKKTSFISWIAAALAAAVFGLMWLKRETMIETNALLRERNVLLREANTLLRERNETIAAALAHKPPMTAPHPKRHE